MQQWNLSSPNKWRSIKDGGAVGQWCGKSPQEVAGRVPAGRGWARDQASRMKAWRAAASVASNSGSPWALDMNPAS